MTVAEREEYIECYKCAGSGKVADTDDQEPWPVWERLQPGEDIAVRIGLVKPITCPRCSGTGKAKV